MDLIKIPNHEMQRLWSIFYGDPTVRMCRRIIRQSLFANGIQFKLGKARGIKADSNIQDMMDDYWLPCCEDAFDSILVLGFVVIEIVKVDKCNIPVVRRPGTYGIGFDSTSQVLKWTVWDINGTHEDPLKNAFVFDYFGNRPTTDGHIISHMTSVYPDISYWQSMSSIALRMETKRMAPPILTEVHEQSTKVSDNMQYDFYADGDGGKATEDMKFQRNASQIEQLKHQQQLFNTYYDGETQEKQHEILDRVTPLPAGQKITNVPLQTGRGDLIAMRKAYQDAVCGIMGVPRSMVMSDTPHKADAEGTHRTFQGTIMYWKDKLSKLAEDLYSIVYEKNLTKQIMGELSKRKRCDEENIYQLKKKIKCTIDFPVTPFTSNAELYNYYQQGVITWQTYVTYVHQNTSMPLESMPPEPNLQEEVPEEKKSSKGSRSKDVKEDPEDEKDPKDKKKDPEDEKEDPKDKKDDPKEKKDKKDKKDNKKKE